MGACSRSFRYFVAVQSRPIEGLSFIGWGIGGERRQEDLYKWPLKLPGLSIRQRHQTGTLKGQGLKSAYFHCGLNKIEQKSDGIEILKTIFWYAISVYPMLQSYY